MVVKIVLLWMFVPWLSLHTHAPDLVLLQQRVKDILTVLGDFKNRRKDGT